MTILQAIEKEQIRTMTENGAYAENTSGSAMADFFAEAGALRSRRASEIGIMYGRAIAEDPLTALRLAFYTRDARGGLGERRTGRIMFQTLSVYRPEMLKRNLKYIPEYGRWDDLLVLLDTPLKHDVIHLISAQLKDDLQAMKRGRQVSLLAKWLPSVNASSPETVQRGRQLAEAFGMSEGTYRRTLSALRSHMNVTETDLSAKEYEKIIYPEVPSLAMNRYRNAFRKHDGPRFDSYLEDVRTGRSKVNAKVLFPYDVTEKYLYRTYEEDPILEEQWKALPDYVHGELRYLIMADVSGSMYGRPLAASVGLAVYFAERCTGAFHDTFMTFSARPELVRLKGSSLFEKISCARNADWEMNTDLEAAFMCILSAAVRRHVPQEEMPDSLVIISDMEFDACTTGRNQLISDEMKERFARNGYRLPELVFWNVAARHNTFHASAFTPGITLASGMSPSVFESLLTHRQMTAYDFMMKTVHSERYLQIW